MNAQERHYTKLFRQQRPDRGWNACYWDAKRHIYFREELAKRVNEHKRRSKAAKKAWAKRRAK